MAVALSGAAAVLLSRCEREAGVRVRIEREAAERQAEVDAIGLDVDRRRRAALSEISTALEEAQADVLAAPDYDAALHAYLDGLRRIRSAGHSDDADPAVDRRPDPGR